MNLICLPLSNLDVVLEMDWLSSNHVLLNCKNKTLVFENLTSFSFKSYRLITFNEGNLDIRENLQAYMVLISMKIKESLYISKLQVLCEFPNFFPDDVTKLSPKREVEFTIDMILGSSSMSIAPYMMSLVKLAKVKNQVYDLLKTRFVRPRRMEAWRLMTLWNSHNWEQE